MAPINLSFRPTLLTTITWVIGLSGLASLIYFVLDQGGLQLFVSLLRRADFLWLTGALICQCLTYVFASLVWRIILNRSALPLPFLTLLKIGFLQLFANQVFPTSGLSGTIVVLRALKLRGVGMPTAIAGVLLDALSYYVVYLLLGATAFALILQRYAEGQEWLPVLVVFVLLAAAIVLFLTVIARKRDRILPRFTLRWRPAAYAAVWLQEMDPAVLRDTMTNLMAALCQLAVFLLDAATLWFIARSIGMELDMEAAVVSFLVASVFATIAPLPLGLGSFEGASTIILHLFGMSPEAALATTLIFRGLTLWMPMIPGIVIFRSEVTRLKEFHVET